MGMEEQNQNVNDVNKAEIFSKQVAPQEDLALRWLDNRERTIEETNESFRSPVKNLCPVESSPHEQVNTGSNYSLSADPSCSGKRVFPHRANESEVQNNGNHSQAGISPSNESLMFINP